MGELRGIKVGVTGTSGYLGGSLVAHLRSRGIDVVEYRHRCGETSDPTTVRELDLGLPIDSDIFTGVTCLIHAAWDLRETDPLRAWERNVEGSKRLLTTAAAAGVKRIIFVSSMSAYFSTKQDYGLMKLAIERSVIEMNHVVIRPGLVYGGKPGGMAKTLSKLSGLPVIPIFRGSRLFTLHLDDFVAAVTILVETGNLPSAVIGLAHETPTQFREIMVALSQPSTKSKMMLTVPWRPILGLLRVLERMNVPLPVRSDSMLGLVRPAAFVPGREVAVRLGMSFRSFAPLEYNA